MNITESMKYVLRSKGAKLFTELWKEDLRLLIETIKHQKGLASKSGLKEARDSFFEAIFIIRKLPLRTKVGFNIFKEDFLHELENISDPKEKTLFGMSVIAALTTFLLSTLYGVKQAKSNVSLPGLKRRSAMGQFLMAELLIGMTRSYLTRFLEEVETHLTVPEDLKKIHSFRQIIVNPSQAGSVNEELDGTAGKRAHEIVENLKNYIMKGE